jgi:hypothetical protein
MFVLIYFRLNLFRVKRSGQQLSSLSYFLLAPCLNGSRDSSVGIVTRYGLDGPGVEYRWGRDFLYLSRPTLRPNHPTQPTTEWVLSLSRGLSGRAVALNP